MNKTNHQGTINETNSNPDNLPRPALNLARRARQLAAQGNGRHVIELLFYDGRWLIIVNGGGQLEDLGGDDKTAVIDSVSQRPL